MSKGRHVGTPNGANIDLEERCIFKSESHILESSWCVLGCLKGVFNLFYGYFGVVLGVIWGSPKKTAADPLAGTGFCIAIQPHVSDMDHKLAGHGRAATFDMDDGYAVGLMKM